jgi:hypothetical protein
MILLAYFHGEGILFSFLIHVFFGLIGAAALLYGLVRYKSLVGVAMAIVYIVVTLIVVSLSQRNLLLESAGWVLTLPWNAVLPCYNLDRSCTLSLAVAFICAELNAAILYFLTVWLSRRK